MRGRAGGTGIVPDGEERTDLVAAFVRDGLRAGLKVIRCRLPDPRSAAGAADAAAMVVQALSDEVDAASRDGHPGGVTADMAWATGPHTAVEHLGTCRSHIPAPTPVGPTPAAPWPGPRPVPDGYG